MNETHNSKLTGNSKHLRNNMTKEERHLWYDFFKKIPYTVNRQKVIGPYIVDFYCASTKIVIELDGSQHYKENEKEADRIRDEFLSKLGIKVLRYSNLDIHKNFNGVCADILHHFNTSSVS